MGHICIPDSRKRAAPPRTLGHLVASSEMARSPVVTSPTFLQRTYIQLRENQMSQWPRTYRPHHNVTLPLASNDEIAIVGIRRGTKVSAFTFSIESAYEENATKWTHCARHWRCSRRRVVLRIKKKKKNNKKERWRWDECSDWRVILPHCNMRTRTIAFVQARGSALDSDPQIVSTENVSKN